MYTLAILLLILAFASGASLWAVMILATALGALSIGRGFDADFGGAVSEFIKLGTGDAADVFSTIPLFIFAGYIMAASKTADRLVTAVTRRKVVTACGREIRCAIGVRNRRSCRHVRAGHTRTVNPRFHAPAPRQTTCRMTAHLIEGFCHALRRHGNPRRCLARRPCDTHAIDAERMVAPQIIDIDPTQQQYPARRDRS